MICRKGHFHSILLFYNFVWLIIMFISSGYVDAVSVSVMRGDSVSLHTDVEKNQQEEIRWYFNDIHIAEISGDPNKTCTDVQCEDAGDRFRDRLKLDHETGSLIITNTRTTDSGLYKLQINSSSDSLLQLFSVSVYCESLCSLSDSQFFHVKMKRKSVKEGESVTLDPGVKMKRKSVKEGESVTLDPGVVKTTNYLMKWLFNDIRLKSGRFRDRLQLDQTGSLIITNTRTTDSGLYKLQINSSSDSLLQLFSVSVYCESVCSLFDPQFFHVV
uniref:Immunoglobulin domain-containing protein n=1 Tax=Sinocyclocheilus rhinocerous TaxID=307959 RepID=A0A673K415_9TELE